MIKPTPGRVVWYYPTSDEPGPTVPGPLAATVAGVIDDETVNLTVHTFEGDVYARQKVQLCQGDTRPELPYAEWMPYQLGQAAKVETAKPPTASPPPNPVVINTDSASLTASVKTAAAKPAKTATKATAKKAARKK